MKLLKTFLLFLCGFVGITSFCYAIEILDNFSVGLSSTSTARGLTSVSSNGLYYNYYRLNSSISSLYTGYIMNASFGDTSSLNALYGDVINAFYCPYNQSINSTTVQDMFNGSICEFIGTGVIGESSSKYFINDTKNYSIIFITDGYSTSNGTVSSVYVGSSSYGRYELWNNYIKNREGYIKSSACPSQFTSEQCQSEYSLIPVSSVDQSYCENNNLCPVCDNLTGDLVFSNVYINNILHPGRSNIYVNIPDYINWDYSVSDIDFNINVGSGYDEDYINSIININSYRPTSGDFTNVFVSGLTLIFPYIIFALFMVFMWKLIKRIFR